MPYDAALLEIELDVPSWWPAVLHPRGKLTTRHDLSLFCIRQRYPLIQRARQFNQICFVSGLRALDFARGDIALVLHRLSLLTALSDLFLQPREFHG